MDDSHAALDLLFRGKSPPPLTHRLERMPGRRCRWSAWGTSGYCESETDRSRHLDPPSGSLEERKTDERRTLRGDQVSRVNAPWRFSDRHDHEGDRKKKSTRDGTRHRPSRPFATAGRMPRMEIVLSTLGVAFAAFCVWLTVRIFNRRGKWARHGPWSWRDFAIAVGMIPGGSALSIMTGFAELSHAAGRTILLFVYMIAGVIMVSGAVWALRQLVLRFWPAP